VAVRARREEHCRFHCGLACAIFFVGVFLLCVVAPALCVYEQFCAKVPPPRSPSSITVVISSCCMGW
jgi:hypothetical protein